VNPTQPAQETVLISIFRDDSQKCTFLWNTLMNSSKPLAADQSREKMTRLRLPGLEQIVYFSAIGGLHDLNVAKVRLLPSECQPFFR